MQLLEISRNRRETLAHKAPEAVVTVFQRASLFAALSTLIILLLAALVMFLTKAHQTPLEQGILMGPLLWSQGGVNINYLGQRVAHRVLLGLMAASILASPLLRPLQSRLVGKGYTIGCSIVGAVIGTFFGAAAFCWHDRPFCLLAGLAVTVAFALREKLGLVVSAPCLKTILAIVTLLCFAPSLWLPLDLSACSPDGIVDMQCHFSTVVLQGDRLSAGDRILTDVKAYYGILVPFVFGGIQHAFGNIGLGSYIQVIKAMQVAFALLTLTLYLKFARRVGLPVVLAFLMVLPWLHTNHFSISHPNLSAWRLMGFPLSIAVLFLVLNMRSAIATSAIVGLSAGALMMFNLETGLAAAIGSAAYLFFRFIRSSSDGWLSKAFVPVLFVAAVLVPCLALSVVAAATTGHFLDFKSYLATLSLVSKEVEIGYTSLAPEFNPVAIAMLAHAVYALLKLSFLNCGALSPRNALRAAVCTVLLLWFTYYVNRPVPWTLQGLFMLYGFLLLDAARVMRIQLQRRHLNLEPVAVVTLLLGLVLIPQIAFGFEIATPAFGDSIKQLLQGSAKKPSMKVSGVLLEEPIAREVIAKALYVKKLAASGPVTYITADSVFVPKVSGVLSAAKLTDVFQELPFGQQVIDFSQALKQRGPDYVLFDDPKSITVGGDYRQSTFNMLRAAISSNYTLARTENSWQVWVRKVDTTEK